MLFGSLRRPLLNQCRHARRFHVGSTLRADTRAGLTNVLAGDTPPPIIISSLDEKGIHLEDGLNIPSACIFLDGNVFLWDVPSTLWDGWTKEHFEIFETVVPKPELLLFGTGKSMSLLPPHLRLHLNKIGIQTEISDTRNACSTYNLLAEEGRRVAAALLPLRPRAWVRQDKP
ncbi:hypothetical protein PLICRDRAFT_33402 [Plicaturopsis crispa FD-325 SS-3]|nr:hypothetical protein PLICRDRAFT_33402 [Plicaturopsis crispa FD-325 SS-3]